MKFEDAVQIILEHEGGYVNHPSDPGGETNFGIAKRSYPNLNIRLVTKDDAIAIYKKDFWDKCKIELLPPDLRLIVFDAAVNQGPKAAIGMLQAAIGVTVDGDIGSETLKKLSTLNIEKVFGKYAKQRLNRYADNAKFSVFGRGWTSRLMDIVLKSKVSASGVNT